MSTSSLLRHQYPKVQRSHRRYRRALHGTFGASCTGAAVVAAGLLLISLCGRCWAQQPAQGPMLGQPVADTEIALWDFTVDRYGNGLPSGAGSAEQGEPLYRQKCEKCHGPAGRGASAEELAGGVGSLAGEYPDRTIGSYWPYPAPLFDYIRRAMPLDAPFSLSNDQVYALVAYLLHLNQVIDRTRVMDAAALPEVQLPNRDGFIPAYPRLAPP